MKIVVIGADAAGMSAAHTALRAAAERGRDVEIVVVEATGHTSYSACGIPYWIAGDVDSGDDLVARSAEEHRTAGLDLRLHTTATAIDPVARTVTVTGPLHAEGRTEVLGYDELVLATGATAILPAWAQAPDGSLVPGMHPVRNLDDGAHWIDLLGGAATGADGVHRARLVGERNAVVVGAGYIGLEMAEALLRRGYRTTVITRGGVMGSLDDDLGARVADGLRAAGVDLRTGTLVDGIETGPDGRVRAVRTDDGTGTGDVVEADVVVLALGVVPNTGLGSAAGLALGDSGGYLPDEQGRVAPGIWAAGDCCEQVHRLTGQRAFLPLGTHANKQGRALGDALLGGSLRFGGVLGTAITRFSAGAVELEIARTGLSTREAEAAGRSVVSLVTEGSTASGYMPEAAPIAIKVLADPATRALLGVQIVGGRGAGKRIDAAAVALWGAMSVDDLAWMDLSYAPPFATAWEILQIAARRLAERT